LEKKGIFRKLVNEIKSLAKEKDIDIIRLYVHNHNKNAMKVYEKLGMKKNYTVYEFV
jgi:ribosomal protein S18 acetylase RimI-like enzyme